MSPARLQLIARTGHPDFLDLPWDEPLAEWTSDRLVEVGHILRGDDLDPVRRKAAVFEGGDHGVPLIAVDGRGHLVEGERPVTRSATRRHAILGLVIHLRLRPTFPRWGSRWR